MSTHFREARRAEAESLATLGEAVWIATYAFSGINAEMATYLESEFSLANFLARIDDPKTHVILAERSDHILGYAYIVLGSQCPSADLHRAELASLYVLAAFQRQGIGSALLSQAETIAKNVGESLWLSVNAQNVAALQFYARRAYESIGECYFELGKSRHKNVVLVHGSA